MPEEDPESFTRSREPDKKYSAPPGRKQSNRPPQGKPSTPQINFKPATAPYNFVSLPEKFLPAPTERTEQLSGEITLELETLTPLFIGGNGSKNFAPLGTPIIPGSTLRGMFKNLFKVVTCGAFRGQSSAQKKGEDFNDEHIYFRCLMASSSAPAWMKTLNQHYKELMTDADGKKKARPGFLIHTTDDKYFIAPSIYTTDRKDDYITIKDYQQQYKPVRRTDSAVYWDGGTAYCLTGNQWANRPEKLLDGAAYAAYKKELETMRDKVKAHKLSKQEYDKAARRHGKQIIRYTKLEYVDWDGEWLEVPEDVQLSYRRDRKNKSGVNLFDENGHPKFFLTRTRIEQLTGKALPKRVATLIPCHYISEGKQVKAFGHGQCFRVPYERRIGQAVKIAGNDLRDFADVVFGTQETASRVYFEDATPLSFTELAEAKAHLLMPPNPTSYQLYLKQTTGELKHWDSSGVEIRGYKMYWHNKQADWQASRSELDNDNKRPPDDRLIKSMKPLDTGARFKSRIRFSNLSKVELGALMMIFDLDGLKDAAYKIGQGKPLGFGSVKITPTLLLDDESAYTELFEEDGWKSPYRAEGYDKYLDEFKRYLASANMSGIWQKVMDELKIMLDWSLTERKDWALRVKSMSGDVSQSDGVDERFKQRVPLASIFEVVK